MITSLAGAALAGLVGSPHCVAMCGPFAVVTASTPSGALAWHLGRLSTLAILGALAGALGQGLPGPGWLGSVVAAALLVWFSARLAGLGGATEAPPWLTRLGARFVARPGWGSRYALGLVTALLPCGLVYAALSFPIAAGDPGTGAAAMVLFGLGTVPALALAAVGLRRVVATRLWARRALAAAVLLLGIATLAMRAGPFDGTAQIGHSSPTQP